MIISTEIKIVNTESGKRDGTKHKRTAKKAQLKQKVLASVSLFSFLSLGVSGISEVAVRVRPSNAAQTNIKSLSDINSIIPNYTPQVNIINLLFSFLFSNIISSLKQKILLQFKHYVDIYQTL